MSDLGSSENSTRGDTISIAPDGDVILVAGVDKRKMRVSSATLSQVSPVFKALFGPHFREGQQLQGASAPVEIPLPEDPALEMERLCRMASVEAGAHCWRLEPYGISLLGGLMGKYCCTKAFRLQSSALLLAWLIDNEGQQDHEDLWHAACAAYITDCSQAFKLATSRLVFDTKGVLEVRCDYSLPAYIFGEIAKQRTVAWQKFCKALLDCSRGCARMSPAFMQELAKAFGLTYWLPSVDDLTLRQYLHKTRRLPEIIVDGLNCHHSFPVAKVENYSFCKAAGDIESSYKGMCLRCAKEGCDDELEPCQLHAGEI